MGTVQWSMTGIISRQYYNQQYSVQQLMWHLLLHSSVWHTEQIQHQLLGRHYALPIVLCHTQNCKSQKPVSGLLYHSVQLYVNNIQLATNQCRNTKLENYKTTDLLQTLTFTLVHETDFMLCQGGWHVLCDIQNVNILNEVNLSANPFQKCIFNCCCFDSCLHIT